MAYEQYEDTPLSSFPAAEDNWARMSNLSVGLLSVAKQYSDLYNNGNIDSANALLERYPDLKLALFTPDRWNQIRDAIIALERFFLEDVESMITEVAQNAVGINDAAEGSDASTNAYSAAKVNALISEVRPITLTVSGWSSTAPYTQRINLADIRCGHSPLAFIDDAQTKAVRKIQLTQLNKHVDRFHTYDGYLLFECDSSIPTININLVVKGT
ncbi:MAG: hypothetical protein ACRDBO_02650 [Lachnospiraceae bacterium]